MCVPKYQLKENYMAINNIRKFLRHPAPYPDESISGYLIRLAESNGYNFSDVWSLLGFDKESSQNKQPLAYIYGCADYSVLSCRTGFSEQRLKSLAYCPIQFDAQQFVGTYELFGNKLGSRMLRYKVSALCPGCLTESAYQRKIWDLLSLTACPIHKRMLIDCCPQCDKPIHYRRDRMCFCSCGCDFRIAEIILVPEKELRLAWRIYQLSGFVPLVGINRTSPKMPEALGHLDLSGLLQSLFLVSGQVLNGDIWGKFLSHLTVSERHRILNEVLDVYDDFPVNFFKFLTSLKVVFNHRIEALISPKASKQQTVVYHGITRTLTNLLAGSQFEFLRRAFREFLSREKLASYQIHLDYTKTTAEEFFATHLSLQEAARFLNNTKLANKAMIASGALRAYEGAMSNKMPACYINLQDLERVKKRFTEVISAIDAARLIGAHIHQMEQLINAGIINAIEDIKITPVFCRAVEKQQVLDLYDYFYQAMCKNTVHGQTSKKISSKTTITILGIHQINFSEMTKMILSGEIAPVGCDEKKGLNGFVYDQKQIQKLVEEKRKEISKDSFSFDEAARMLGIKIEVFRKLVEKQYIAFIDMRTIIRKRVFLEAITQFRNKFAFTSEIAHKFSTSKEYVNRKLADKNIYPVDTDLHRYNHLYPREEITDVVIEKPDLLAGVHKRRRKKLCSLPEAAKRLGLSESELKLAIERKLIYFCRGKYRQDMMFSERSIIAFKELDLPNVNFLREKEAIKILKIGIRPFKKYLNQELITPEVRPYRKKSTSRFYSIENITALKTYIQKK